MLSLPDAAVREEGQIGKKSGNGIVNDGYYGNKGKSGQEQG